MIKLFGILCSRNIIERCPDCSDNNIFTYKNNLANAANVGKNLEKQGKHKLPSLRSQEKFTEKYKKPLEFFISELNLPDYIKFDLIEENPYNILVVFDVNWEGLIKYQGTEKIKPDAVVKELTQRIKDFLGIEIGNPTYGQLSLKLKKDYVGIDEWIKKTLNKEIKKKFRELPNSRILHAVKFETKSYELGGELKLSFKSWNGRNDFIKNAKELLQSMGYNTNILNVTS